MWCASRILRAHARTCTQQHYVEIPLPPRVTWLRWLAAVAVAATGSTDLHMSCRMQRCMECGALWTH